MKITAKEIVYKGIPYGYIATIPKGTKVVEATNLPGKGQYWAEKWKDMTIEAEAWYRNYGFLLSEDEVENG